MVLVAIILPATGNNYLPEGRGIIWEFFKAVPQFYAATPWQEREEIIYQRNLQDKEKKK